MSTNLFHSFFPSSEHDSMQTNPSCLDIEYKEFLPEVSDTWTFIQKLSTDTIQFREIYDSYRYERSEDQQRVYFEQLKSLDENISKVSFTIHQRIQFLEKLVQPALDDYRNSIYNSQRMTNYTPAYVRIAQSQLNSLKASFKRILTKHNADSIEYQNDLQQSIELARIGYVQSSEENNLINPQIQLTEEQILEEKQLIDLEKRLESIKLLKDRVRQMNEMTMALFLTVQEQNDLTDNIWLNTSAGSDYIAQSVEEFRLVKNIQQAKMNLWMKLICLTFAFLFILIVLLVLIFMFNQR